MIELIFYLMMLNGNVVPMNETNDGRELYILCVDEYVFLPEGSYIKREECHEYVYKEEILEFISTATFEYNDFLPIK